MTNRDIHDLLRNDPGASEYFQSLPSKLKDALLAHGDGINTLHELRHAAKMFQERGGRP